QSGLALTGANVPARAGANDGLFTARDVTQIDLAGTEMVVLSACETLPGRAEGTSVMGLQRAFTLAGARTGIMSLWRGSAAARERLLVDYYRRVLAGEPRAEALRQAQLAVKKRHPNPLAWGGWLCLGDPGPLPPLKA